MMSPDDGAVKRSRDFALMLGTSFGICHKDHIQGGKSEITDVTGDVKGKTVMVPDDIIGTGGTLLAVNEALRDRGVKAVYFMGAHCILCPREGASKTIEQQFREQEIKLVTTDTVPKSSEYMKKHQDICEWLSVSKCLAGFIQKDFEHSSLRTFLESFPRRVLEGRVSINNYLIRP